MENALILFGGIALIASIIVLLDWLGNRHGRAEFTRAASGIEGAVDATLGEGQRTVDLGGKLGTRAYGAAVAARLEQSADKRATIQ